MRARKIVAHDHRSPENLLVAQRAAAAAASHVHEAQPGGARLEFSAPAALALPVAVGRAADPLQQQRAHGPPTHRRPDPWTWTRLAAAGRRRPARAVPVAAAAEGPRMVRRRAEARQLLAAAGNGGGSRRSGSGGGGRRAGCRGHVLLLCCVLRAMRARAAASVVGAAGGCFYTRGLLLCARRSGRLVRVSVSGKLVNRGGTRVKR